VIATAGGVLSILAVTVTGVLRLAPLVAGQVTLVPPVSVIRLVAPQPVEEEMPDSASETVHVLHDPGAAVNAAPGVTGGSGNGVGSFTATCSGAKDNAGNTAAPAGVTYAAQYGFGGLFSPVSMGISNLVNAGQSVPVKWQLTNSNGGFVSAPRAVASITSANVACGGGATSVPLPADTSGASGLHYDTTLNQYIFSWKTDKTWAGSCRRFILQLDDGTSHTAEFTLR
jgi:hypothetical protein